MNPIESFVISISDDNLEDLRRRLQLTRWPDEVPGSDWQFGTSLAYMKELTRYWLNEYDWRAREKCLNRLKQFKTRIDGLPVHFIHERGEGPDPIPLLVPHGWPGSVVELQALVLRLTRPSEFGGHAKDSFTVVAPSLPGHGFSFEPNQRRTSITEISELLAKLMVDYLGYGRFGVQGHDWGAFIATRLGYAFPSNILGIHVSLLAVPREPVDESNATPEELQFNQQLSKWSSEDNGYIRIMGTRPQTLSYGLTDSPVGLAAWIIEKFRAWSDCNGDVDKHFSRDVLLDNVMLYWLTGATNSTFWPYYARLHEPWIIPLGELVDVPMGYAEYPAEILTPPRSVAETTYGRIERWTQMPSGGHFPALEGPDALAREIRQFFRPLRTFIWCVLAIGLGITVGTERGPQVFASVLPLSPSLRGQEISQVSPALQGGNAMSESHRDETVPTDDTSPEAVVQRQLDAYNAHDLNGWLHTYANDAQQFEYPAKLLANGIDAIRERAAPRFQEPNLHATLLHRSIIGDVVIDSEDVARTFPKGPGRMQLVAIYHIVDGRIQRATFIFGPPQISE